jgi:hypothetical protein
MEVEVRNAMEALARGKESLDPRQALGLKDHLHNVDVKFDLLRKEISRLNALLADQKDRNDALKSMHDLTKKELDNFKSLKTKKKVTTSKKNLTPNKK